MDRAAATQWLLANPRSPVLRSCIYTKRFPQLLVVTYRVGPHVLHSLVERDGDAFYSVVWNNHGTWSRETRYSSDRALEQALLLLLNPVVDEDPAPYEVSEDPVPV
jgi:hypothetical protein